MSVDSGGLQANFDSKFPSLSADGRFVAFYSEATHLVMGDTNGFEDIFVHDNQSGATERVSISSAGVQSNNSSNLPSISSDGRYVAFDSYASNLVAGDTNASPDIFVYDRQTGQQTRVSVDSAGVQGNGFSRLPSISQDGRYVAFYSTASNLVAGDTNLATDVFVHDRDTDADGIFDEPGAIATNLVSVDSAGTQGNGPSGVWGLSISAQGLQVAFYSDATNLVPGMSTGQHIFVHDSQSGATVLVSIDSAGVPGNGTSNNPSISGDGRFVAFTSWADNLVAGDTNGTYDVFRHDLQSGSTILVSVDSTGAQGNSGSSTQAAPNSLSADGRHVAFGSGASNLVAADTNGFPDVFVHDCLTGATERVSIDSAGSQGNSASGGFGHSLSADGRYVAFASLANNLVASDTNNAWDVFLRDRGPIGPGTDLCQPGTGGVIGCPCSNPPANSPRGCDNSAATGGAQLASDGWASLANDTLRFVTNGEKLTATSIVLQGDIEASGGIVMGQGVRCVGGVLKRLYTKTASGGSITAPAAGDATVSARSAALGDNISAGTGRWYAVYYRDPIVLGGCSATSTFNITQTQLVAWWP